jgi:DNA-binding SARP family transcriptional activator
MSGELVSCLLSSKELLDVPVVVLLGGPYVSLRGCRLEVPDGSKKLLAFVALGAGTVDRRHTAGSLWQLGNDERAAGNLRSALWRLKGAGIDLVDSQRCSLTLRGGTLVDVGVLSKWAARLVDGSASQEDLTAVKWRINAMDLLPGWYDDWVIFERERIRQRLLHALEALSRRLIAGGRFADAVETAISAVSCDPLRESANRVLIEAHLAEGNVVEARRAYERYRDTVRCELGVEPSEQLTRLMRTGFLPRHRIHGPAQSAHAVG